MPNGNVLSVAKVAELWNESPVNQDSGGARNKYSSDLENTISGDSSSSILHAAGTDMCCIQGESLYTHLLHAKRNSPAAVELRGTQRTALN